jgi:hypothetical protein
MTNDPTSTTGAKVPEMPRRLPRTSFHRQEQSEPPRNLERRAAAARHDDRFEHVAEGEPGENDPNGKQQKVQDHRCTTANCR